MFIDAHDKQKIIEFMANSERTLVSESGKNGRPSKSLTCCIEQDEETTLFTVCFIVYTGLEMRCKMRSFDQAVDAYNMF